MLDKKPGFHMVCLPKMVGLLIQLGIECDDAPIRIFEFLIHPDEFLLSQPQFIQSPQELMVLLPQFLLCILGGRLDQLIHQARQLLGPQRPDPRRENLLHEHLRALSRRGFDFALVHQTFCADEAQPHAGAETDIVPPRSA